jgi:hypothetical protein
VAERDNQWSTQISQIRFGASVQAPEPGVGLGLLVAIGVVGIVGKSRRRIMGDGLTPPEVKTSGS